MNTKKKVAISIFATLMGLTIMALTVYLRILSGCQSGGRLIQSRTFLESFYGVAVMWVYTLEMEK